MDKENLKIESISLNNKTYKLQENNSCIVVDDSIYCTTENLPVRPFGLWAGIILAIVLIVFLYLLCRNGR